MSYRASTPRTRTGSRRRSSAKSASASGPATADCDTHAGAGCARTSLLTRWSVSPEKKSEKVAVEVDGRELTLSNLSKVLYPEVGFTKGEVIDYYTRIAPVLLPHIESRPFTFKRYPDGVDGKFFFEKNAPSHAPPWVKTVTLASPGSTKNRDTINYALVNDVPSLVWAANLATLEMHVPMWRVGRTGKPKNPDLMVYDLDPGPPATIVECCQVACHVRDRLDKEGIAAYPKTS